MIPDLALTAREAIWFLPFAVPICAWVMYTDLKLMLIRNYAVLALTLVYLVVGFFVLPLEPWAWRLLHLVIVLAIGFVLSATIGIGAGDAKFAAAMAPFVLREDALFVLALIAVLGLVGVVLMRIARAIPPVQRATADWVSFQDGKLFPWGLALAGALVIYLVIGAVQTYPQG